MEKSSLSRLLRLHTNLSNDFMSSWLLRNIQHSNITGCAGVNVSLILQVYRTKYSTVCRRILGIGHGLGFTFNLPNGMKIATLEDTYLSSVFLTHGKPGNQKHIWSIVASWNGAFIPTDSICPCINPLQLEWPQMTQSM